MSECVARDGRLTLRAWRQWYRITMPCKVHCRKVYV